MGKVILSVARFIIIILNIALLSTQPNTETEMKFFFIARTVFFLMLLIDYVNVTYYNKGIERILGIAGAIVAVSFAFIDICAFMNLLVLELVDGGYNILGNDNNFITSIVPSFKAQTYVLVSSLFVVIVLGLEVVNTGVRGYQERENQIIKTKASKTA